MWQKSGGGSEARKPRSLKSGGLKPSSLIEVYAYARRSAEWAGVASGSRRRVQR